MSTITCMICGNVQHNPIFDCCSMVLVGVFLMSTITCMICGNVQHNPTFDCCSMVLVGFSLLSTESNTSIPAGPGIDVARVNAVQGNQKDLPDKKNRFW